jgi:hypothetical protein
MRPESVLKKNKSNSPVSIILLAVREAVALGECLVGHISTHKNPANKAMKINTAGEDQKSVIILLVNCMYVPLCIYSLTVFEGSLPEK